jgi:hypothetical protein
MSSNSSADILGKLEAKYPDHPGIPHYIIHSLGYPELAERGVFACRKRMPLRPCVRIRNVAAQQSEPSPSPFHLAVAVRQCSMRVGDPELKIVMANLSWRPLKSDRESGLVDTVALAV